jgi:type IV fimbrial biogenesis protein FimT
MRYKQHGFTLIELMVVVALAAIMAALATPSFKSFIASQRVKTAASDFAMTTIFARSEAIKRNSDVTITAVSSGATGWQDGWTVTSGTTQLSKQQSYPGVTFSGPTTTVTYQSSGRLSASDVPTMKITGQDGSVRCVAIDLSGMPKSSKSTTGVCP